MSHTLAVLSRHAATNRQPSGLKQTICMTAARPFISRTSFPVRTSQSIVVPSEPPVTTYRPSGLKQASLITPVWRMGGTNSGWRKPSCAAGGWAWRQPARVIRQRAIVFFTRHILTYITDSEKNAANGTGHIGFAPKCSPIFRFIFGKIFGEGNLSAARFFVITNLFTFYPLGNPPSWMMRYGISVLAGFVFVLLALAWFVMLMPDFGANCVGFSAFQTIGGQIMAGVAYVF